MQIAIVGGGPGGLTLARLLQLKGAQLKRGDRSVIQSLNKCIQFCSEAQMGVFRKGILS